MPSSQEGYQIHYITSTLHVQYFNQMLHFNHLKVFYMYIELLSNQDN